MHVGRFSLPVIVLAAAGALCATHVSHADGGLSIDTYGPRVLARGERITVRGDFAALDGAKPRVFGRSTSTARRVPFRVVEWSDDRIVADVRRVPRARREAAEGGEFRLHVTRRGGRGVVAAEPFVTSAPIVHAIAPEAIHSGWPVRLTVECLGTERPRVTFGGKRVPRRHVTVEPAEEGARLRHVWVTTPKVRSVGEYMLTVASKRGVVGKTTALQVRSCDDPGFPKIPKGNRMVATLIGNDGSERSFSGFCIGFKFFNSMSIQGCDARPDDSCREVLDFGTLYPQPDQTGPFGSGPVTFTDHTVPGTYWESTFGQVQFTKSTEKRIEGTVSARLVATTLLIEPQEYEVRASFSIKRPTDDVLKGDSR